MEYKKIPSVTRVPLSERVYKILMESIVSGDLLPGTELREQHVAKQMGVSATPVREAFKRLASDGMIELIPYRGAVVKVLDQQEIREAYACREALEHLVAKEVIERVRQEDIDRLYRMIEGFRQAEGVEEILLPLPRRRAGGQQECAGRQACQVSFFHASTSESRSYREL